MKWTISFAVAAWAFTLVFVVLGLVGLILHVHWMLLTATVGNGLCCLAFLVLLFAHRP